MYLAKMLKSRLLLKGTTSNRVIAEQKKVAQGITLDSMTNATYHTLTTDDFSILQNF
jgi:hypothetical protein